MSYYVHYYLISLIHNGRVCECTRLNYLPLDILYRDNETTITRDILPRDIETSIRNELRKYPTGMVVGFGSETSQLLAIIGGVSNLTQVSYSSAADELDGKDQYPFLRRVIPPVSEISKAGADYFT